MTRPNLLEGERDMSNGTIRSSVMWKASRQFVVSVLFLLWIAQLAEAQSSQLADPGTVDVTNRYANSGALIAWVKPNDIGLPEGLIPICSGVLIHERVFLTAGHCTGPAENGLPPFIKIFVSFSPNALDRSKWVPVISQITHPSMPPCAFPPGCDPTITDAFKAGDPEISDLGLVFLEFGARFEPARLARAGILEDRTAANIPMVTVGYGSTALLGPGEPPPNAAWDGLRRFRRSELHHVLNKRWATWKLPSSVCFGDSGSPTFFNAHPLGRQDHDRVVAIASDGGIDCISADTRSRVDTVAVQQWIKRTVKEQLGPHINIAEDDTRHNGGTP